ncbi:MAG: hypothetical protein OXG25_01120 [Gammaproteobacteria bacterium]|nr:hypothetical protein [Gammaproteobacteria bacterium]
MNDEAAKQSKVKRRKVGSFELPPVPPIGEEPISLHERLTGATRTVAVSVESVEKLQAIATDLTQLTGQHWSLRRVFDLVMTETPEVAALLARKNAPQMAISFLVTVRALDLTRLQALADKDGRDRELTYQIDKLNDGTVDLVAVSTCGYTHRSNWGKLTEAKSLAYAYVIGLISKAIIRPHREPIYESNPKFTTGGE